MHISINGEQKQFENKELSILKLLEINEVESPDMVAVQLNGEFVDKENYQTSLLSDGDSLEFLYFMGGGAI